MINNKTNSGEKSKMNNSNNTDNGIFFSITYLELILTTINKKKLNKKFVMINDDEISVLPDRTLKFVTLPLKFKATRRQSKYF